MTLRVIGLPRVSTIGQMSEGFSQMEQVESIETFCETSGLHLVAHFPEVKSGKDFSKRDVLREAVDWIKNPANNCEGLVVAKIDRYGRDMYGGETVRRELAAAGKRLFSVEEAYLTPVVIPIDESKYVSDKRDVEVKQKMLESERERLTIVHRFAKGRSEKVKNGGWGGHRPPYECDVVQGELVVNRERLAVIHLIYSMRSQYRINGNAKHSYNRIVDLLNQLHVPTCHNRPATKKRKVAYMYPKNNLWNTTSVRKIWNQLLNGERFAYGYTLEDLITADYHHLLRGLGQRTDIAG